MNIKVKAVDRIKMLSFIAASSKYSLFHILTDNGQEFNATEIADRESGILEFKRLFAMPIYSDGIVTDIKAIAPDEFFCQTPYRTYTIKALHNKPKNCVDREHKTWEEIEDLMDTDYFSEQHTTYVKELDMIILAVDPWLLGELLPVEQAQIQNIIDVYLGGLPLSMQMSRTVCFQVKKDCDKIYAGIYDLENRCSVTSKLIYDDQDKQIVPYEFYQKAQSILEYAKKKFEN